MKAGERVRARLLDERSKKGKWQARIEGGVAGVVDGEAPPDAAAAGEVELVVAYVAAGGRSIGFTWPKKG